MDEPFRTVSGPALTGHHGTKRLNVYTLHSVPQVWTCLLDPQTNLIRSCLIFDVLVMISEVLMVMTCFQHVQSPFSLVKSPFPCLNHHVLLLKSPSFQWVDLCPVVTGSVPSETLLAKRTRSPKGKLVGVIKHGGPLGNSPPFVEDFPSKKLSSYRVSKWENLINCFL